MCIMKPNTQTLEQVTEPRIGESDYGLTMRAEYCTLLPDV